MEKSQLTSSANRTAFWKGAIAILPLSISVIPWGLLAGSFAIDSGLTGMEAQAMSAILFAGSAQLVAAGVFKAGIGMGTMLLTTFFITSRHFLYSISMRQKVSPLAARWRVALGFLLTDELFAVCSTHPDRTFSRWFALGAGLTFYLIWNIASFIGIFAGSQFPALNELGLDFAVAATFIALVAPQLTSWSTIAAFIASLIMSVVLSSFQFEGALICASIGGMVAGYLCKNQKKHHHSDTAQLQGEQR
jgi:4-azaleucine resistance transporter AzlC